MENDQSPVLSVAEFVAVTNQTLEYAYPSIVVVGEVESFKVSQGKFVFFNLKDSEASVGCFMMVFALRLPLEDGMKVMVRARPKLTQFGKFSLTVDTVKPVGEGSIKKGFEALRAKLDAEGLFAPERKRQLPYMPQRVGIISSIQSAGYADFMKIADERWGGIEFFVYHVAVQGLDAPDEMLTALGYFNQLESPLDAVVIIRGGGSADDLAAFNDEKLVRAIAASRTPTLVGVGHEIDTTLSDLAADVRAATPSNAAQILLPDRQAVEIRINGLMSSMTTHMQRFANERARHAVVLMEKAYLAIERHVSMAETRVLQLDGLLNSYNPEQVLRRGYAIVRGKLSPGGRITVESQKYKLTAEVKTYEQR